MLNASRSAIVSAVLILIGAGCAPSAPANDLPAVPPVMMEEKDMTETGADAMMDQKNGAETKPTEDSKMMKDEGSAMMKADLKPYYIAYSAEQSANALKEGRAAVYYFWASWCPICQAEEPKLKSWIESSGLPVAGFRVNYDAETELKAKYKIPYQHTAVFLNAKGEEVARLNGPVDEAVFLAALKKATQ